MHRPNQAGTEFTQHGRIKTMVGQFKRQGILPVNAGGFLGDTLEEGRTQSHRDLLIIQEG